LSVTGSSLPQALIQRRQRLTYDLRLTTLVILVRRAPQPKAGDSAVAQPTTTPFTGLVRAPVPIGDMPPCHIPRPTSLRALHCVPSGVVVRAWIPGPFPAATDGSGFMIDVGSDSAFGIRKCLHFRELFCFDKTTTVRHRFMVGLRLALKQNLEVGMTKFDCHRR
jgi:hypothetical protein